MKRYITVLVFAFGVIISSFAQHLIFRGVEMNGTSTQFIENLQMRYPNVTAEVLVNTDNCFVYDNTFTATSLHNPNTTGAFVTDTNDNNQIASISTYCEVLNSTIDRDMIIKKIKDEYNNTIIGVADKSDWYIIITSNGIIQISELTQFDNKTVVNVVFSDRLNNKVAQELYNRLNL